MQQKKCEETVSSVTTLTATDVRTAEETHAVNTATQRLRCDFSLLELKLNFLATSPNQIKY